MAAGLPCAWPPCQTDFSPVFSISHFWGAAWIDSFPPGAFLSNSGNSILSLPFEFSLMRQWTRGDPGFPITCNFVRMPSHFFYNIIIFALILNIFGEYFLTFVHRSIFVVLVNSLFYLSSPTLSWDRVLLCGVKQNLWSLCQSPQSCAPPSLALSPLFKGYNFAVDLSVYCGGSVLDFYLLTSPFCPDFFSWKLFYYHFKFDFQNILLEVLTFVLHLLNVSFNFPKFKTYLTLILSNLVFYTVLSQYF